MKSRTGFAILGVLAKRPASGYDVRRELETTTRHFWSESFGQIYPELRRLEQRGLVRKRDADARRGPRRHRYAITAAGRRHLRAWLAEPAAPPRPRNELLLKLYFGSEADAGALGREVARHGAQYRNNAELFEQVERSLGRSPSSERFFTRRTLRYGIEVMRALASWCDETERLLRRRTRTAGSPG